MKTVLLALIALIASARALDAQGVPIAVEVPATTGTASISGRIVDRDSGRPIWGALLSMSRATPREVRYAATDPDGRFEFPRLPAGPYVISVSRDGFDPINASQRESAQRSRNVTVTDGQALRDVNFSMIRGTSLAGVVRDERGEPVSGVSIAAAQFSFIGRRRLMPVQTGTTDDIGAFRLYGLPPGDYYVAAMMPNQRPGFLENSGPGFQPTYYPGSTEFALAQRVTLKPGARLDGVDLTVFAVQTAFISGTLVGPQGQPLPSAVVQITRPAVEMPGRLGEPQTRADGTFMLNNLAPGEYELRTDAFLPGKRLVAVARVDVNGTDITDLRLVAEEMQTVKGRVVLAPGSGAPPAPSTIAIGARPPDPNRTWPYPGDDLADDWTFELQVPPEVGAFQTFRTPPGWFLRAVRLNGVDVTDSGIDFSNREGKRDIEIELTDRPPVAAGTVRGANDEPATDYTVVLFPRDRDRRNGNPRYFSTARAGADGGFTVKSLAAGDYYAAAFDFITAGDASDPQLLQSLETRATSFTLKSGETTTLNLKIIR